MLNIPSINGYWFLLIITILIIVCLMIEAIRHRYSFKKIPVRVHVNGTRGKSSVTRLIAAGLRAGGIRTFAKTTGTLPRMIFPDGSEQAIYRIGHTNIVEQIRVIRKAVQVKADALVIECMAVQPLLQSLAELKLVRSTHGVLTNVRPDHLDVMGPTEEDVALALAGTMTVKGDFFTTENKFIQIFQMAADDRDSRLHQITPAAASLITEQEINAFSYAEFKENVALALAVCQSLGVKRELALQGMWEATPDPGALSIFTIEYQGHQITFANGFAANDPLSTQQLWCTMIQRYGRDCELIAVVNCRADRKQRSQQLAESLVNWEQPDRGLAIGYGTNVFLKTLAKKQGNISHWIDGENWDLEQIIQAIINYDKKRCHLVIGIANIAGIGLSLVEFFGTQQQQKQHLKNDVAHSQSLEIIAQ